MILSVAGRKLRPLLAWLALVLLSTAGGAAPGAPQIPSPEDRPLPTDKSGLYAVERLLGRSRGQVTANVLIAICPNLSPARAAEIARYLNPAMAEAGIKTNLAKAAFLAQLAQESAGFTAMEEFASGADYEGRADLGNTQPGDGVRFKGRGFIQITGRANYGSAGRALGLDLIGNPALAATTENAARIAAWYWQTRNINAPADAGDFVRVTRLINGGTNGLAQRQAYYGKAQAAIGPGR
jgi:putative chitinase